MTGDKGIAARGMRRRDLLVLAAASFGAAVMGLAARIVPFATASVLRPPGALAGDDFLAACIRCFQCASVCPNQCIQFRSIDDGPLEAWTPFIEPREAACILCMKCTVACPTDALTEIAAEPDIIASEVKMGTAWVNEDLCYSFADRICGVCYYACPFPDSAIRLGEGARPYVDEDACVGCGNCERACIHLPQAIRVTPASEETAT